MKIKFEKIKLKKNYNLIIDKFKSAKILIIGDFILDRYTICNALGKTQEILFYQALFNYYVVSKILEIIRQANIKGVVLGHK